MPDSIGRHTCTWTYYCEQAANTPSGYVEQLCQDGMQAERTPDDK